jgi:hypothetical protein
MVRAIAYFSGHPERLNGIERLNEVELGEGSIKFGRLRGMLHFEDSIQHDTCEADGMTSARLLVK